MDVNGVYSAMFMQEQREKRLLFSLHSQEPSCTRGTPEGVTFSGSMHSAQRNMGRKRAVFRASLGLKSDVRAA